MYLVESLDVKSKMHDVTVAYDVFLAFNPHFTCFFTCLLGFKVLIIR
jgi:hypothetical protein